MHGRISLIYHSMNENTAIFADIFKGIMSPFKAVRYHSLVIDKESLMPELIITAKTYDGIIMAVQHRSLPIYGVQFHPEVLLFLCDFLIIKKKIVDLEHLHRFRLGIKPEFYEDCSAIPWKHKEISL